MPVRRGNSQPPGVENAVRQFCLRSDFTAYYGSSDRQPRPKRLDDFTLPRGLPSPVDMQRRVPTLFASTLNRAPGMLAQLSWQPNLFIPSAPITPHLVVSIVATHNIDDPAHGNLPTKRRQFSERLACITCRPIRPATTRAPTCVRLEPYWRPAISKRCRLRVTA